MTLITIVLNHLCRHCTVKDIKIQLHTQLFNLYHLETITEHAQKNQSINIQIQA